MNFPQKYLARKANGGLTVAGAGARADRVLTPPAAVFFPSAVIRRQIFPQIFRVNGAQKIFHP
jgi:hypothetical protein